MTDIIDITDSLTADESSRFTVQEGAESEERFTIDTPEKADWAIKVIKEDRARRDLFIQAANFQIEKLEQQISDCTEKCNNETAFLLSELEHYIDIVPAKSTKTQKTFVLPSGKLKKKFSKLDYKVDNEQLLGFLEGDEKFIKIEKKVKWSDFKAKLTIKNNKVVRADTGEIVEGVTLIEKPGTFDIE